MLRSTSVAHAPYTCTICGSSYDETAPFCPEDGAPLGSAAPAPKNPFLGLEISGSIRIEKLIGVGSMGQVYRAFQQPLGRAVAVKILHEELSANPTIAARFEREVQMAARLSHPHVIQVFATGQLAAVPPAAGALYLVMEYLEGISLRSALVAARGALPILRSLRIVLQLCEAVGEAHERGIVHCEVKPENVMLLRGTGDTDFVKVLDFGMAGLAFGDTSAVTKAGLIFGTARYLSPEGAAGKRVGPQADVYSIATIFFQMLAGRTPFEGSSSVDLLTRQRQEPPPPLTSLELARAAPPRLAAVIMANLAKRPEERETDARALGRALFVAARASGFTTDDLLPSSTMAVAEQMPPFSPTELARPMRFAGKIAGPPIPARPPFAGDPSASSGADERWRRGTVLAFLAGCALGGAGLALLGARALREESPALPPAPASDRAPLDDASVQGPAVPASAPGQAETPDR
jgi:serine/threonine protein kinase